MQAKLLIVDRLDPVELVGDVGVLLGFEEVGRAKVVVTHLGAGVHARNVDLELARDLGGVVIGAFKAALELVELAANRGYRKVLGGETHSCMHFVDFVLDHLVLLEFLAERFRSYQNILACASNYSRKAGSVGASASSGRTRRQMRASWPACQIRWAWTIKGPRLGRTALGAPTRSRRKVWVAARA